MTMTAISKGLIRIMKLLSVYSNRQNSNLQLNNKWTNECETATVDQQQNDQHLSKFNTSCCFYYILTFIIYIKI